VIVLLFVNAFKDSSQAARNRANTSLVRSGSDAISFVANTWESISHHHSFFHVQART
jgi:hypothetical protein